MNCAWIAVALAITSNATGADDPATDAVFVELVRPDQQLSAMLDLFEGLPVRYPAEWLASWRRAARDADVFDKATQALIASLNPEMVREWRLLDGAVFGLVPGKGGSVEWYLGVPRDDGTLASVATAIALTDGDAEEPLAIDGARVDRLTRGGGPYLAQSETRVSIAGTREGLVHGFRALNARSQGDQSDTRESGIYVGLNRAAMAQVEGSVWGHGAAILKAFGVSSADARMTFDGGALVGNSTAHIEGEGAGLAGQIDPGWLEYVPDGAAASLTVALDRKGRSLATIMRAIDAIAPTSDDARQGVGWRARINVLAAARGVFPEVELWPVLRGATVAVRFDQSGSLDGAVVALHARDAQRVSKLMTRVLPRLAAGFGARLEAAELAEAATGARAVTLTEIGGRDATMTRKDDTVLIVWNEPAFAGMRVPDGDSDGTDLRERIGEVAPNHVLAVWPGRVPLNISAEYAVFARALRGAQPLVVVGRRVGKTLFEHANWEGARGVVARLISLTPQMRDGANAE